MAWRRKSYYKLGNYQRSLQYAQKAYVIDSLLGNEGKMAVRLTMQGAALGGMKRDDEAVAVYQKAIPTLRSVGNIHSLGIALNQMGFILLRQKQEQAAVEAFREASGIFSKMGDLYNGCTARKGLYEAYWNLNPDSARHELERFNALRDSLYSTSTAKALARYEAEFGNDQLRKEVSAGKNAHLRDLLISAAVLLLLIGLFLWLQRRRTRAHRAQLRRLFQELHRLESLSAPAAAETVVNPELTAHSSAADTEEGAATPIPSSQTTPSPDSVQPSVESSPADMADTLCRQVIEVVRSGMAKGEVSVSAVASKLNMGEQTFRRRFVCETGQQPKMFITSIQMDLAARLLLQDSSRPVGEVARECGFDEASAFSHAFKKAYACSPTQYRQSASPA